MAIWGHFGPFWAMWGHDHFWTIIGPFWEHVRPFWTMWDNFGPFWTSFGHFWTWVRLLPPCRRAAALQKGRSPAEGLQPCRRAAALQKGRSPAEGPQPVDPAREIARDTPMKSFGKSPWSSDPAQEIPRDTPIFVEIRAMGRPFVADGFLFVRSVFGLVKPLW